VLPYLAITLFAILEGEIYYSAMCAKAVAGDLQWLAVIVAGALGGAAGDQIVFYVLRGRIHWLDRFPRLGKYRDVVSARVHSHETGMVLASRFLPGLRTAIPIACAYAGVRPLKFSLLNLVSAFGWASAIMLAVRSGARTLSALGLNAWWGPFVPAVLVILFFRWLARPSHARSPGP
jgi:membrane protein DedA with SNARE-associated domain